jgi:Fe-S-cluster containining protein
MERKCERCGSCCVQLGDLFNVSKEDIERWVNEMRSDILWYCDGWNDSCFDMLLSDRGGLIRYLSEGLNMEMWFNPQNGYELFLCPFLRKTYGKAQFECLIHNTKPDLCRDYICDPKDMRRIVKKPFEENFKEYMEERRRSPSHMKFWRIYAKEIADDVASHCPISRLC